MKIIKKILELINLLLRIFTLAFSSIALMKLIIMHLLVIAALGKIPKDISTFSYVTTILAILISTYYFYKNKDSKKKLNILIFFFGIIAIFLPIVSIRYIERVPYFVNRPYIDELTDPYAYLHIWPVVVIFISTIYSYFIYNILNIKNKAK
ncbi:hypothetical protein [Clostridium intestinale]|uniref:Uncharacterized protein n=2 Tax=Clostridium intestinale TaxID=36845 RepID=U2N5S0_9CLOT|nr:hypothetical protein [Clostridium intestinale]ERK30862.1 hypothetical protein CINTURNW_1267 [Clostridium intestinale URNW]QLY78454.1 hypothetical protein HZF06_15335 [Clostridium intestinale]